MNKLLTRFIMIKKIKAKKLKNKKININKKYQLASQPSNQSPKVIDKPIA